MVFMFRNTFFFNNLGIPKIKIKNPRGGGPAPPPNLLEINTEQITRFSPRIAVSYKELINKTSPHITGENSLGDATIFINRGSPKAVRVVDAVGLENSE